MRDNQDDAALVAAARAGDRDALDRLLRRHYDRVHAVCRRIAGAGRDADDAAQEAMIGIVRGLARFDGRSAFSTWVYRIATNAALDELRRRRRRPAPHAVADDEPWHGGRRPARRAPRRRRPRMRMAIDDALDDLPEEFRAAGRAARRRRPRLRRDRRGAVDPARHREVAHRPWSRAARRGAREPATRPPDVQPRRTLPRRRPAP